MIPQPVLEDLATLLKTKKAALLLDFDGTLSPLVKDRMKAFPAPQARDALRDIIKAYPDAVYIITGRPIHEFDFLFWHGVDEKERTPINVIGEHGTEARLKGKQTSLVALSDAELAFIATVKENLFEKVKTVVTALLQDEELLLTDEQIEEMFIEIKPRAVALHTRPLQGKLSAEKIKAFDDAFKDILESLLNESPELKTTDGKDCFKVLGSGKDMTFELCINPARANKGTAVTWLQQNAPQVEQAEKLFFFGDSFGEPDARGTDSYAAEVVRASRGYVVQVQKARQETVPKGVSFEPHAVIEPPKDAPGKAPVVLGVILKQVANLLEIGEDVELAAAEGGKLEMASGSR